VHSYVVLVSFFELVLECITGKDGDPSKWFPGVIIYVVLSYFNLPLYCFKKCLFGKMH